MAAPQGQKCTAQVRYLILSLRTRRLMCIHRLLLRRATCKPLVKSATSLPVGFGLTITKRPRITSSVCSSIVIIVLCLTVFTGAAKIDDVVTNIDDRSGFADFKGAMSSNTQAAYEGTCSP